MLSVQIPYPNPEDEVLNYQIRSIDFVALDAEKDLFPLCFIGTSKGTLYSICPISPLTPVLVYHDANKGVILDIQSTKSFSLDHGASYVTLVLVAMGVGDILVLAVSRPA